MPTFSCLQNINFDKFMFVIGEFWSSCYMIPDWFNSYLNDKTTNHIFLRNAFIFD